MYRRIDETLSIPRETVRSAKAVFGPGNFYIQVGEHLGHIMEGIEFGQLATSMDTSNTPVGMLSLITVFQFFEGLTDIQALDAVRTRIDWKYALHLPLLPPFFHPDTLCEFRFRVSSNPGVRSEFQKLIDRLITLDPPGSKLLQNSESSSLLSMVCQINRRNWVWQAMQQAIAVLAAKRPEWLLQIALPHWFGRFNYSSSGFNNVATMRQSHLTLEALGSDIHHLLEEVRRSDLRELSELQEIKTLRHIWNLHFENKSTIHVQGRTSRWNNCNSCQSNSD